MFTHIYCESRSSRWSYETFFFDFVIGSGLRQIGGDGGNLYFKGANVTSWDTPNKEVQKEHKGGRAFIYCVSEIYHNGDLYPSCTKTDKGECRMVSEENALPQLKTTFPSQTPFKTLQRASRPPGWLW